MRLLVYDLTTRIMALVRISCTASRELTLNRTLPEKNRVPPPAPVNARAMSRSNSGNAADYAKAGRCAFETTHWAQVRAEVRADHEHG